MEETNRLSNSGLIEKLNVNAFQLIVKCDDRGELCVYGVHRMMKLIPTLKRYRHESWAIQRASEVSRLPGPSTWSELEMDAAEILPAIWGSDISRSEVFPSDLVPPYFLFYVLRWCTCSRTWSRANWTRLLATFVDVLESLPCRGGIHRVPSNATGYIIYKSFEYLSQ